MDLDPVADRLETVVVLAGEAADHPVDLVPLVEEQFRQVAAVLPGDAGDQGATWHPYEGYSTHGRYRTLDFMNRNLAIVPAHNEAAAIGATVAAIHRWAPEFDVLVIDDGSTDEPASWPPRRARRYCGCRTTSASAGACRPATSTRRRTATKSRSRSTATGSTTRARSRTCSRCLHANPDLNMVTGSRFLDADEARATAPRRLGESGSGSSPGSSPTITAQKVTDPTFGLPDDRPQGDRAVRRRLPDGLSRGRGDHADAHPPPAQLRDPGHDGAALDRQFGDRRRRQSAYYMVKVLLAVFVALFRKRRVREATPVVEQA